MKKMLSKCYQTISAPKFELVLDIPDLKMLLSNFIFLIKCLKCLKFLV